MVPYKIIDADAHMCEPPNLWVERIDKQFRERAPRIVKNPGGKKGAFFVCENLPPLERSLQCAAVSQAERVFPSPVLRHLY